MNALLCWAVVLGQATATPAQDLAPTARAQARLHASVAQVELGEPFELVLEVRHALGDAPQVEPGELAADLAWEVLEAGDLLTLPAADGSGARLSEVRWSVVALEPGVRALPAPRVFFEVGGDEPALELEVERGELSVGAVLAPGEDAPRALPSPVDLEEVGAQSSVGRLVGSGLGTMVAVLLAVLYARRRARAREASATAQPGALARLAELEAAELRTPEEVREVHYAMSRALREHIDGSGGAARAALTDEEWVAALGATGNEELARLMVACGQVKYGAETPTHWATRERVVRARALAQAHVDSRGAGVAP